MTNDEEKSDERILGRLCQTPWRFKEWSRGDASDIDGKPIWARERERTSQKPYNYSGFVILSSFVIRHSVFAFN
jgi:hypothetical protein